MNKKFDINSDKNVFIFKDQYTLIYYNKKENKYKKL